MATNAIPSETASRHRKISAPQEDVTYYAIIHIILIVLLILVMYPLIYIVSASFSSPYAVSSGRVILWPVDLSLEGYRSVFKNSSVLTGYANTILYTTLGTAINIVVTMAAAYPLSRRDMPYRDFFMILFSFTMIFSGGMIPLYIQIKDLHMIDSLWAMVLPGAMSVYNMIIARTFLQSSIPGELLEAAQIDGCNDVRYFFSIVMPLSKALLAVLVLFYAIGHWNAYFNAFLYLNSQNKFPLQIVLRQILLANSIASNMIEDPEVAAAKQGMAELLKYSLIMVSTVPVMCLYPFVQKYFVKGVMIGSIKG